MYVNINFGDFQKISFWCRSLFKKKGNTHYVLKILFCLTKIMKQIRRGLQLYVSSSWNLVDGLPLACHAEKTNLLESKTRTSRELLLAGRKSCHRGLFLGNQASLQCNDSGRNTFFGYSAEVSIPKLNYSSGPGSAPTGPHPEQIAETLWPGTEWRVLFLSLRTLSSKGRCPGSSLRLQI